MLTDVVFIERKDTRYLVGEITGTINNGKIRIAIYKFPDPLSNPPAYRYSFTIARIGGTLPQIEIDELQSIYNEIRRFYDSNI